MLSFFAPCCSLVYCFWADMNNSEQHFSSTPCPLPPPPLPPPPPPTHTHSESESPRNNKFNCKREWLIAKLVCPCSVRMQACKKSFRPDQKGIRYVLLTPSSTRTKSCFELSICTSSNWQMWCFPSSAWVSSLGMSALYLFAPVSTTLCQRYGCRVVTIIGGLLCISGLVASSFCTSLPPLYFTYGLVWGLGESLCYFSAFLILSKYFRARIALAYGIVTCGGAIGGISLSPLTQLLFSSMSVANTFRALAALYIVVILCSLVFRPVKTNVAETKHRMFDWTILQNKGYLVYALSTSMFMFGHLVPYVHLVRRCHIVCLVVFHEVGSVAFGAAYTAVV